MKYLTVNRMFKNPDLFCLREYKLMDIINEKRNCSFDEIKTIVSKIVNKPIKSTTIEELVKESKQDKFVLRYIEAFIA